MQMLPLALLTPYFRIRRHIYTWKCIVCLVTLLPSSHTFKCLISIIFRLFSSFHIGLVAHRMKRNFFFRFSSRVPLKGDEFITESRLTARNAWKLMMMPAATCCQLWNIISNNLWQKKNPERTMKKKWRDRKVRHNTFWYNKTKAPMKTYSKIALISSRC